jgi:hypothetical protein
MKPFLAVLALVAFVFGACHKSHEAAVYGQWKLTHAVFYGSLIQHFDPGQDSTIVIDLQFPHSYSVRINGSLFSSGTYQVKADEILFDGSPRLKADLPLLQQARFSISANTLYLTPALQTPAGSAAYTFERYH